MCDFNSFKDVRVCSCFGFIFLIRSRYSWTPSESINFNLDKNAIAFYSAPWVPEKLSSVKCHLRASPRLEHGENLRYLINDWLRPRRTKKVFFGARLKRVARQVKRAIMPNAKTLFRTRHTHHRECVQAPGTRRFWHERNISSGWLKFEC